MNMSWIALMLFLKSTNLNSVSKVLTGKIAFVYILCIICQRQLTKAYDMTSMNILLQSQHCCWTVTSVLSPVAPTLPTYFTYPFSFPSWMGEVSRDLSESLESSHSSSSPKLARDMVSMEIVSTRVSLGRRGLLMGGAYKNRGTVKAGIWLAISMATHWEDVVVFASVHQTRRFLQRRDHLQMGSKERH